MDAPSGFNDEQGSESDDLPNEEPEDGTDNVPGDQEVEDDNESLPLRDELLDLNEDQASQHSGSQADSYEPLQVEVEMRSLMDNLAEDEPLQGPPSETDPISLAVKVGQVKAVKVLLSVDHF